MDDISKLKHQVKALENVTKSIMNVKTAIMYASESSKDLGRKIYYLNAILTIITLLGVVATVIMVFK